jgi:signal transduction histidine kinase
LKLTLIHKGLLLVSIPLCFEVTIFAVLINLQDKVEQEAQRIDRNNKINDTVNVILRDGIVMSDTMRLNSFQSINSRLNKKVLTDCVIDIKSRFADLKQLANDDPIVISQVEGCERRLDLVIQDIKELKHKIRNADFSELNQIISHSKNHLEHDLYMVITGGFFELAEKSYRPADDVPSQQLREQIKILLKCALCLSALFALFGTVVFSKHLVGRLSRLSDNANRLASGKKLLSPVGGSDEVAELDRNFHYAADLIEAAKRMREEVTAMISHDLKTPLQAIRSYLEMLEHGVLGEINEQGNKLLSVAHASAEHMFGLIDNVLQLEKLRTGNVKLQTTSVRVIPLINRCMETVGVLAKENGSALLIKYDPSKDFQVDAEEFWLEQVFVNVLSNAIKFSPPDSEVTVNIQRSNKNVEVRIADHGPGIPETDKKLIFERFHRVQSTASVAGTGLGLPIAKELIELHHGSITVESEVGKGSTFAICLPLLTTSDMSADTTEHQTVGKTDDADGTTLGIALDGKPAVKLPSKKIKLTLLHKGLILISVPLCFELTIFGALWNLQDQVERESQRINGVKRWNDAANLIMRDLVGICEGVQIYSWRNFVLSSRVDKYMTDISRNFQVMKENAPSQTAINNTERGEANFRIGLNDILASRTQILSNNYEEKQANRWKHKLQSGLSQTLATSVVQLANTSRKDIENSPSNKIRESIRALLKWSIGLSVLFALIGAAIYSKGIVGRLSLISNNAKRLGKGEPLLAPLHGSDEVAELDKNFHYAATLIEEAKRMRQEVTAMITHDLKTPLQSIRSYLEMIEDGLFGEVNEHGDRLLGNAMRSCDKMVTLINSVLQLERLRTGNVQLQIGQIELAPFLVKCVDSVKVLAEEKNVVLSGSFDQFSGVDVKGDAFWLEQVFVNILSNAIKFTPPGSTVSVKTEISKGNLDVRITDQGPGISAKDTKLIFDRFQRTQGAKNTPGTGLGLPIAKELIEMHHGAIEVSSEIDKGSTFTIRLPISQSGEKSD